MPRVLPIGVTQNHLAPVATLCGLEFSLWVHRTITILSTAVATNDQVSCLLRGFLGYMLNRRMYSYGLLVQNIQSLGFDPQLSIN